MTKQMKSFADILVMDMRSQTFPNLIESKLIDSVLEEWYRKPAPSYFIAICMENIRTSTVRWFHQFKLLKVIPPFCVYGIKSPSFP